MKKFTSLCLAILAAISIGCQHKASGNLNDALEELNKEYEAQKEQNGEDSSLYSFVDKYKELSQQFEDSGNLRKVIECEKTILEIYTRTWNEPTPKIAFTQWYIGENYVNLKDCDSAETYLHKAIETATILKSNESEPDSIDPNGRIISDSYRSLSFLFSENGEKEKAIEYLENAIQYQPIEVGQDKYLYAVGLDFLASLYEEQSRYSDAAKLYENSLKIFKEAFPDSTDRINEIQESLSATKIKAKQQSLQ